MVFWDLLYRQLNGLHDKLQLRVEGYQSHSYQMYILGLNLITLPVQWH
jgi:hypothetical protein